MHHRFYVDDDGNMVQEFDSRAIDHYIEKLQALREAEPGDMYATPSVIKDGDGVPESMGEFIFLRVKDEEEAT